jgi:hypothetical protein
MAAFSMNVRGRGAASPGAGYCTYTRSGVTTQAAIRPQEQPQQLLQQRHRLEVARRSGCKLSLPERCHRWRALRQRLRRSTGGAPPIGDREPRIGDAPLLPSRSVVRTLQIERIATVRIPLFALAARSPHTRPRSGRTERG